MSTTIRVGTREMTAEGICEHMSRSSLLPQLLRETILDRVLSQWEPASPAELGDGQAAFEQCYERIAGLTASRDMDRAQLTKIAERTVKLQQFKQGIWGGKLGSYYLERKSQLDRVICSVMQVEDGAISQELYFRIQSGEKTFAELAFKYSQGIEARDGGKVGPIAISSLHPDMARQVSQLELGQVSPLFTIGNAYVFVRLEQLLPAQFDDSLRQVLLDELFEKWLQASIASEIGLISVETDFIPPDFMTNSQRVITDPQSPYGERSLFPVAPPPLDLSADRQPEQIEPELLSQLESIANPPAVESESELAGISEIDIIPAAQSLSEYGDIGLVARIDDIIHPPAVRSKPELVTVPAIEITPPPEPIVSAQLEAAPVIEVTPPPAQIGLENEDNQLLLAYLDEIIDSPAAALPSESGLFLSQLDEIINLPTVASAPKLAATPAIAPTPSPQRIVAEHDDQALLLAHIDQIIDSPAAVLPSENGFFLAQLDEIINLPTVASTPKLAAAPAIDTTLAPTESRLERDEIGLTTQLKIVNPPTVKVEIAPTPAIEITPPPEQFGLERGDTGLLLAQLGDLAHPPAIEPELEPAPAIEITLPPEQSVLERGDTGLLLAQLGDLAHPPAIEPELEPAPAIEITPPPEQSGLERGDTGLLLAQLGDLAHPPAIEPELEPAPAIEITPPPEQFGLERGDTGLLLAQLGDLAHPPVVELELEPAPAIEITLPPEQSVLERGDTGLLLAQLGDLAHPPAELAAPVSETSSFNTTSSFIQPQAAPEPITYISDLDREFDTQKWLAILAITITTLIIGLGSFYQLRSTGLDNHTIPQQERK
jgi:PPIC-type PPIASE domain